MSKLQVSLAIGLVVSLALNAYALAQVSDLKGAVYDVSWVRMDSITSDLSALTETVEALGETTVEAPANPFPLRNDLESRVDDLELSLETTRSRIAELERKFNDLCISTGGRVCL